MSINSKKQFVVQARVTMDVFTVVEAENAAEAAKLTDPANTLQVVYSEGYKPEVDDDVVSWCFDPLINRDNEKPNHGISVGITKVTEA